VISLIPYSRSVFAVIFPVFASAQYAIPKSHTQNTSPPFTRIDGTYGAPALRSHALPVAVMSPVPVVFTATMYRPDFSPPPPTPNEAITTPSANTGPAIARRTCVPSGQLIV